MKYSNRTHTYTQNTLIEQSFSIPDNRGSGDNRGSTVHDFQLYSLVCDRGFKGLMQQLEPRYEIPHRKTFSRSVIPSIYEEVKPNKAQAFPLFHVLTGCDTVSSFVGHGKKTAWNTWNALPELTNALLTLSCAPSNIPGDTMSVIERFVILLYDSTSMCTEIDQARQKLFAKRTNVKQIPPTRAALEHIKRTIHQGGHLWGQTLVASPVLPSPTNWGWMKTTDGMFEPYWSTLPEASKVCSELVSCKCKMGCVKNCKCKKMGLECTALCTCEGDCSQD